MKKHFKFSFALLTLLALTACVGANAGKAERVKCPACGYEFHTDSKG